MEEERDEEFWAESRCGLLLHMMKERFEDRIEELLDRGGFENMEELDHLLGVEIRKFYDERDAVKKYYKPFIHDEEDEDE